MRTFLVIVLCLCMTLTVYASDNEVYQYEYNDLDITIEFNESTHFSADERHYIADLLVYGDTEAENTSTYALCWLTGHDYQYDYVTAVHHRVLEKIPRCEETTYEVETCSNCDHLEYTAISTVYVDCCPEE